MIFVTNTVERLDVYVLCDARKLVQFFLGCYIPLSR